MIIIKKIGRRIYSSIIKGKKKGGEKTQCLTGRRDQNKNFKIKDLVLKRPVDFVIEFRTEEKNLSRVGESHTKTAKYNYPLKHQTLP